MYSQPLTAANWSSSAINLYVDVDGDLPVPGSSTLRMTLEHAQVPLPVPLVCEDVPVANYATSTTGCVERAVSHRESQLVFVPAAWQQTPAPVEAGSRVTLQAAWRSIGFGTSNGAVTARFLLPPGLGYYGHGGITQWTCSAAAPDAQGQLVTCTTPGWFDGINESQANIVLRADVAPDVAVPGPLPVLATISNAAQPAPDFALCAAQAPPVGCGAFSVTTCAARLSRMDILELVPGRAMFNQGEEARISVSYANIGEGDATGATLEFALPPGFSYVRTTGSPTLACSVAAGTPASGQTLGCRYAATFGAGVQGSLNLFLDVLPDSAPQSLLVASASDEGRPGPALQQCIDDPASTASMVGCGRAVLQVSPWIFCDGFERLGRACGLPQQF